MIVKPNEAANATVAVATTAMISRVLSDERRSKSGNLGTSSLLDDGNSAHGGQDGLRFAGLRVGDELFRVGGHRRRLVHECERHGARIAGVGRIVTVDLEDRELHLERL